MIPTFLLSQLQTVPPAGSDSYLIQQAVTQGGIGAILFIVWLLSTKYFYKQFQFALTQNQEQYDKALKQNQEQFDKALQQMERQHKDNLDEQRKISDRLFNVMEKDAEYKEVLTGVLTEMKDQLVHITNGSK